MAANQSIDHNQQNDCSQDVKNNSIDPFSSLVGFGLELDGCLLHGLQWWQPHIQSDAHAFSIISIRIIISSSIIIIDYDNEQAGKRPDWREH